MENPSKIDIGKGKISKLKPVTGSYSDNGSGSSRRHKSSSPGLSVFALVPQVFVLSYGLLW